jgi:colicin import membrane protein
MQMGRSTGQLEEIKRLLSIPLEAVQVAAVLQIDLSIVELVSQSMRPEVSDPHQGYRREAAAIGGLKEEAETMMRALREQTAKVWEEQTRALKAREDEAIRAIRVREEEVTRAIQANKEAAIWEIQAREEKVAKAKKAKEEEAARAIQAREVKLAKAKKTEEEKAARAIQERKEEFRIRKMQAEVRIREVRDRKMIAREKEIRKMLAKE